jgi:hypothetical protein
MCDATSRKKKDAARLLNRGRLTQKRGAKKGSLNKRTGDKRKEKKEKKSPKRNWIVRSSSFFEMGLTILSMNLASHVLPKSQCSGPLDSGDRHNGIEVTPMLEAQVSLLKTALPQGQNPVFFFFFLYTILFL